MSGMMGKINLLTSGARAIDRVLDIADAPTENLPPVLRNLSISIAPGRRLGVVGRTGAGKTSLINALLQFIDIESGTIYIDGVDIATVKIDRLRNSISVIPQDPFLFSGTLRENLSMLGGKTDEELKMVLRKVAATQDGRGSSDALDDLDMAIQPGGENLSHGQRQMVCLARAILDPRRIVILDEATSGVDQVTDSVVQRVIRREFAESTMIVVAHRLATVADLDQVLVLDEGMAVESGSPAELMQKKGVFWDMVNQGGDAESVRMAIERGS
ncbi:ABC transporter-like protein [Cordyceps fumosorosea ARSEF 2679]|uniref:ABC transporter-like protein n=1 Tax=Cordyceps fumosorosea (strain ARSEF 2679) TaxID=1081104 RepID=A0A167TMX1_CORFA|nr:ABC transporter-like protein [Cordyceps fumosorosea ARSEF 2679]OAA60763.1 ABC transporter-like protein [Cordyceps fumosorosea ARSEF 2679]